jgi:hypothetical protein
MFDWLFAWIRAGVRDAVIDGAADGVRVVTGSVQGCRTPADLLTRLEAAKAPGTVPPALGGPAAVVADQAALEAIDEQPGPVPTVSRRNGSGKALAR